MNNIRISLSKLSVFLDCYIADGIVCWVSNQLLDIRNRLSWPIWTLSTMNSNEWDVFNLNFFMILFHVSTFQRKVIIYIVLYVENRKWYNTLLMLYSVGALKMLIIHLTVQTAWPLHHSKRVLQKYMPKENGYDSVSRSKGSSPDCEYSSINTLSHTSISRKSHERGCTQLLSFEKITTVGDSHCRSRRIKIEAFSTVPL